MSSKNRHLLKTLEKVAVAAEMVQAQRELGGIGPKKYLVVHVLDDESSDQAKLRTFAANPWVGELSPAARERLIVILVTRDEAEKLSA